MKNLRVMAPVVLGFLVAGLTVGCLSALTETSIDNTIIPVVLLIISLMLLVGKNESDGNNGTKMGVKGDNRKGYLRRGLRFTFGETAFLLILLCVGLVSGTVYGEKIVPAGQKDVLHQNFSAPVVRRYPKKFSFIVLGDTRTEPYMIGGKKQVQSMKTLLKKRYNKKHIRLFFDPTGLELRRAEVFDDEDSKLILYYLGGWPHFIVETSSGKSQVIMRDTGRKWVFDRIVASIKKGATGMAGGALFLVHGGDIPVFGFQGTRLDESPYWQLFEDELLKQLPPPDRNLGLPGRVLAAVGNHETWGDEELSGLMTTMPWLKDLGLSRDRRVYSVPFENCQFIFLDSGGYSSNGEAWTSIYPDFEGQMDFLVSELERAKKKGIDHVFIVYHKPSFAKASHDPLPARQNPHKFIRQFSKDLNIVVFNSHNHTTEHYFVDGVRYLVLGAAGAPQKFKLTENRLPVKEYYWQGKSRVEEYNYLQVEVEGPHIKGLIHRFRPTSTENPMSVVEVFCK